MRISRLCLALFLTAFCALPLASAQTAPAGAAPAETAPPAGPWRHFENLVRTINDAQQDLASLRQQLQASRDEAEQERLREDIDRLSKEVDSLQLAWEMWATGGVDLQLFSPRDSEKFDWRRELESVFEPIVVELRRLTERPRKMERLRSEQAFYQQRLAAAETALHNVADYRAKAPSEPLAEAFSSLEARWTKRRDDLQARLELVNFEMEELVAPTRPGGGNAATALKELFSGRLLNLFLAVTAAALTYGVLWQGNRLYSRLASRRGRRRTFFARAVNVLFLVIAIVLTLLAAMAVLYVRGDWILLGLLLIVLVATALTLQRSLPGYLSEARLLLNIGPAREGERVIYNGLPWLVQSLNVYSTLVNPALRGGRLQLPTSELSSLISRPHHADEPWFPTREGDFVILDDNTYGRVITQTPEMVEMRVISAVRTYPVASFLEKCPHNLSKDGFGVVLKFGIDYQHQPLATTQVRTELENFMGDQLRQQATAAHLRSFFVEFDEAAASSLNYLVYAAYAPEAAEFYYPIRRLLQRLAVDACNAHGWTIPFNQMTVHMADPAALRPM